MSRTRGLSGYAFLVRQLGAAARRGISPLDVIEILRRDSGLGQADRRALEWFGASIARGGTISEAMRVSPRVFPEETRQWIGLAEERGELPAALEALGRDLGQRALRDRTVRLALIWPICVSVAMALVFVVIGGFVLPPMKDLFEGFGVPLPRLTRLAFSFGAIFFGGVWLPTIALLAFGLSHRDLPKFLRHPIDRALDRIGFVRRFRQARFSIRLVDLLRTQSNDLPLLSAALAHLGATAEGLSWRDAASRLQSAVAAGTSLSQALALERALPRRLSLYIELGDKMQDRSTALSDLGEAAESELTEATARFERGAILMIYLALGIVVGTFVIAVYMPIFRIGLVS
ncbi:MAG: type II secretion system F family protein [Burkholderiaceae bacterium]|nr:type II secretion system F family protein [Burkholderiaceae bacterium]